MRPAARPNMGERSRILHELPTRIRVGLGALGTPGVSRASLETRISLLEGVRTARVNGRAGCVVIEYDRSPATRRAILRALEAWEQAPDLDPWEEADGAPAVPELVISGTLALLTPLLPPRFRAFATTLNIAPAVLRGASTLLTQGFKVPVLDATALLTLTLARGNLQAANTTAFLLRLAEYLEHRTERRSEDLLRHLLRPVPGCAWVEADGQILARPASDLVVGDVVVVGPGEMVPADGLVLSGSAAINEAMVTGESLPCGREPGDRVRAGTTVAEGRIHFQAERVGKETGLARLSSYIQEALRNPAPTQRLAHDLADRRLSYTLGMAGAVFLWTGSLERLASMLLVDFSCSLKLGVPVAFRAAMHRAAEAGAVPKGGGAIEALGRADTCVFDKTGTLTRGRMELVSIHTFDPVQWPEDRLLALTASLEEHAQHPIAQSIVDSSQQRHLGHVDHAPVEFIVAHGLRSEVDGLPVVLGNRHFLEEHEGVDFSSCHGLLDFHETKGHLLIFVAYGGRLAGYMAFRDEVRPEARQVLADLRRDGIRHVVLLTGDRRDRAAALAQELGIDLVYAEVEPEAKALVVEELRRQGRKVAFIGDGVNDGPALARAQVGIAMPKGTELARATADILLIRDDLRSLLEARRISRRTLELIETQSRVALAANTGIMGAAGMGLLSPMASAILHNGTTLALLLGALGGPSPAAAPGPVPKPPAPEAVEA